MNKYNVQRTEKKEILVVIPAIFAVSSIQFCKQFPLDFILPNFR